MKKILFVILAVLVALCITGCGTYIPPSEGTTNSSGGSGNTGGNGGDNAGGNSGDTGNSGGTGGNTGYTFTVTLAVNGKIYTDTSGIKAQWTGKNEVYDAEFIDGVATVDGLDGEYHITLSALPKDPKITYTYDPNGYIANNSNRDTKIELLEILKPGSGSGTKSSMYKLTELGTYRANLTSRTQKVWYYYYPKSPGWYSITSWVDTSADIVNPKCGSYNGNIISGVYYLEKEVDSGGSAGSYTKNFRMEYKIYQDEIGNTKIFNVYADTLGSYPVTVDFTIKYEGEYIRDEIGEPVFANEQLFYKGNKPAGTFRYVYKDTNNILDGKRVKLNPADNYYHLYDTEKYASNNGFGPILFAKLSKDCEVFVTMDYKGVVLDMGFNWNQLNEGLIRCVVNGDDYAYMISGGKDDKNIYHEGYAKYCNDDGVHPVTEEIKNFLFGYASREWYFDDGEGWAENIKLNGKVSLRSSEENQWLFACGYYI